MWHFRWQGGPDERASRIEIIHIGRQWQITWFDFPQSSVQSDIPKTKATDSVATTQLFNYCPSLKEVHILLYRYGISLQTHNHKLSFDWDNKRETDESDICKNGNRDTSDAHKETGEFNSIKREKRKCWVFLRRENLLWFTVGDVLTSRHHLPTTHTRTHQVTYHKLNTSNTPKIRSMWI